MKFNFSKNINSFRKGPTQHHFSCKEKEGVYPAPFFYKKSGAGFTLLETLVAITILTFAIVATFTAAQSGLSSAIESRNQVVGYYLAQEAVEYIRNVRDSDSLLNMTSSTSWLAGIAATNADPCYSGKICTVDVTASSGQLSSCNGGAGPCANVAQDQTVSSSPTYGMYGLTSSQPSAHSSWTPTSFNRQIQITVIGANEAEIAVTVTWSKGSQPLQTYKLRESLFNWQS
jgi:type II secretory pathway pseudopilin PulG